MEKIKVSTETYITRVNGTRRDVLEEKKSKVVLRCCLENSSLNLHSLVLIKEFFLINHYDIVLTYIGDIIL